MHLSFISLRTTSHYLNIFGKLSNFWFNGNPFCKILLTSQFSPRLLLLHSMVSLSHKRPSIRKILMTSLHMIWGRSVTNKKSWLLLWVAPRLYDLYRRKDIAFAISATLLSLFCQLRQKSICLKRQIKSNQIFHYTRCSMPKRVTSLRGPSPRHCARATQLLSKKCCSSGEPLATLCSIWPAQDLNLGPPVQRWTRYRSTNWPV